MNTVTDLSSSELVYDFVVVGGGTAGCVIASRLAEQLPGHSVLVIEGGPSDHGNHSILDLKRIVELWGGEYDYNYTSVEQAFGNSDILHSRAKVLGGCSSHNGGISFYPFEYDAQRWEKLGAKGWNFAQLVRLIRKLRVTINRVDEAFRNAVDVAFVESCTNAFNIPALESFNQEIVETGKVRPSAGFIEITHNPSNGYRSSASTAYIHPILRGEENRPNLKILTNTWVERVNVHNDVAKSVQVTVDSGRRFTISARREIVLCAGAIDTPRLLLLSGIGSADHLIELGIPVVKDIPGVGENLMDHPETIIMWEMKDKLPSQCLNHSEVSMFLRREPYNANGDDRDIPDTLFHMFSIPFDANLSRMGYKVPENAYCMIPNIPRPRSRGRIALKNSDPKEKPLLDFRYLSDADDYDQKTLVYAIKAARKMAEEAPFKDLIKSEVAPGPQIQSYADLVEYNRRAHNTVYHPCGTAKMGDVDHDPMAVVDPQLRVRGIKGLRIADASVFPIITSINPMLTVLAIGERAAELIIEDASSPSRTLHKL